MPNHWESSARPLFVKTVFVNGNRHAILSQEDPLLHSGTSWLKKQSRPNSSLSLSSTLSTSSTETQDSDSNMRIKSSKRESIRQRRGKDISSELQGCLIKLRIASGLQNGKNESAEERIFYKSLDEMKWNQNERNESLKQKRKKCNHDKHNRKKNLERSYIKSAKESNVTEITNESDNRCYVYNLENNRVKKNYCFVKISSKPSHFILKCGCNKTWSSTSPGFNTSRDIPRQEKNKTALSATFHNLIMTTDSDEKSQKYSSDYLFTLLNSDPCELYWNSYLARSFYNSLSERVIQWIDLKSKRKKNIEKTDSKAQENSSDNIERIFVGKTFLDERTKPEHSEQFGNKISQNLESKVTREKEIVRNAEKFDEDVETEVKVEDNIETALSIQKNEKANQAFEEKCESFKKEANRKDLENTHEIEQQESNNPMVLIPQKFDSSSYMSSYLQDSIVNRLNTSLTKPCISVQDIMLNDDSSLAGKIIGHNKKKTFKDKRNSLKRQKNVSDFGEDCGDDENDDDSDEDKEFRVSAIKCWERGILTSTNKRNTSANNFQIYRETTACNCNKSGEEYAKSCKNSNLTQQHLEKTQRSINNQNITRSTLCQNLLSPQQRQQKIPWLEEEERKNSWTTEKNLGRPQLHIFMPAIPSNDPSEESMSECESFLSEIY